MKVNGPGFAPAILTTQDLLGQLPQIVRTGA